MKIEFKIYGNKTNVEVEFSNSFLNELDKIIEITMTWKVFLQWTSIKDTNTNKYSYFLWLTDDKKLYLNFSALKRYCIENQDKSTKKIFSSYRELDIPQELLDEVEQIKKTYSL